MVVQKDVLDEMCKLVPAGRQGLTLLHISAQRKRFPWDKGCIWGLSKRCFSGCLGFTGGSEGVVCGRNGSG